MKIILIIYGICKALFGYKMYRVSCFFTGLLVGTVLGIYMNSALLTLVLALGLGVASVCFMRIGIFVEGFVCGFLLIIIPAFIQIVLRYANAEGILELITELLKNGHVSIDLSRELLTALIIGIVVGLIGLVFTKVVLIIITSALGAVFCGSGLYLTGIEGNADMAVIIGVILAIAGILFQLYTNRKKVIKSKELEKV